MFGDSPNCGSVNCGYRGSKSITKAFFTVPSDVSSYRFAFVVFHERICRRSADCGDEISNALSLAGPRFLSFSLVPPMRPSSALRAQRPIATLKLKPSLLIFLCRRTRHPVLDLRQGGCGCNHGSQCTRHHGQGRTEEADREHEVPGVHGTVAPVEEHRGVSASWCRSNRHLRRPRCRRPRRVHPLVAHRFSSLLAYHLHTSMDTLARRCLRNPAISADYRFIGEFLKEFSSENKN